jgi:hypothetical protein
VELSSNTASCDTFLGVQATSAHTNLIPTHFLYLTSTNTHNFTVRKRKQEEAERERIIKEHALAELEKKQAAEAAAAARKKADDEAVQRWHHAQAEKAAKEKKEREEAEAELRNKMRERLLASGVPENQIQAMIDGKRPMMRPNPGPPPPPMHPHPMGMPPHHHHPGGMEITESKTTYTRMARKHLSLEALRARAIEWELDQVRFYVPRFLSFATQFTNDFLLYRIRSIFSSSVGCRKRSKKSSGR